MANQFKLLVGSSALAAMLAACGGGGSSSAPASNTSDAATRALPPEIAEIIDEQNELTDACVRMRLATPVKGDPWIPVSV